MRNLLEEITRNLGQFPAELLEKFLDKTPGIPRGASKTMPGETPRGISGATLWGIPGGTLKRKKNQMEFSEKFLKNSSHRNFQKKSWGTPGGTCRGISGGTLKAISSGTRSEIPGVNPRGISEVSPRESSDATPKGIVGVTSLRITAKIPKKMPV